MEWFRLDATFPAHPKVVALADALDVEVDKAIAVAVRLWAWTASTFEDGDLSSCTARQILYGARIEVPGRTPDAILEAFTSAGLLDRDGDQTTVHGWAERHGPMRRVRDGNRERQKRLRDRQRDASRVTSRVTSHDDDQGVTRLPDQTRPDQPDQDQKQGPRAMRVRPASGADAPAPCLPLPGQEPHPDAPAFPLAGKKRGTWTATKDQIEDWTAAFPNVAVLPFLRKMSSKVRAGAVNAKVNYARAVVKWLSHEQDSSRPPTNASAARRPGANDSHDAQIEELERKSAFAMEG